MKMYEKVDSTSRKVNKISRKVNVERTDTYNYFRAIKKVS